MSPSGSQGKKRVDRRGDGEPTQCKTDHREKEAIGQGQATGVDRFGREKGTLADLRGRIILFTRILYLPLRVVLQPGCCLGTTGSVFGFGSDLQSEKGREGRQHRLTRVKPRLLAPSIS